MQNKLNWQAYTNADRNNVIEEIKNAISSADGYILNFSMYSDLALTLSIEIEENNIERLHKKLSLLFNLPELEQQHINLASKKDWLIFMNISFSRGKGQLKQEIPEVPG